MQTLHRYVVAHGGKGIIPLPPHRAGGGIVCDQIGELLFQIFQFPVQFVIGKIVDFRVVVYIILLVMIPNLFPQCLHSFGGLLLFHRNFLSFLITMLPV